MQYEWIRRNKSTISIEWINVTDGIKPIEWIILYESTISTEYLAPFTHEKESLLKGPPPIF